MIKQCVKIILFVLLAGGLILSCASQEDTVYLNNKINAIQRQTKNDRVELENTIENLKEAFAASENKSMEIEKKIERGSRIPTFKPYPDFDGYGRNKGGCPEFDRHSRREQTFD